MLNHLYIKNFALIEELDIDVQNGFTVITGETGAGKSIILGAIALLRGERAESKHIQEGASKCIVEASFNIKEHHIEWLFNENDLDYDDECLIRRELTSNGKSRAYINDTPVNLSTLREITSRLIDIHSQHQNLLIGQEDFQLNVVDTMADSNAELSEYQQVYKALKATERELDELKERIEKQRIEEDYIRFQYTQLKDFSPKEDEEQALEEEQNTLSHAEDIKTALYQTDHLINSDSEECILNNIRQARQAMLGLVKIFPKATDIEQRLENAYIELKDIAYEVSDYAEHIEYDPQRLEEVNHRLDELYALLKKHNAKTSEELVHIFRELETRIETLENSDEQIKALEADFERAKALAEEKAETLSEKRKESAKYIEGEITQTLVSLGMPHLVFRIEIKEKAFLSPDGKDTITFIFSANKSVSPKPISQVASGGEIARVMLAIKAMTSKKKQLPTIVFDEIDTGVSGSIAESMALIMRDMCATPHRQVITITHLPQIAACGTSHLKVYKKEGKEKTTSHICNLDSDSRISEIANMLSGNKVSEAAIKNAKELLKK